MPKVREQKYKCKGELHMETNERREQKFMFLRQSLRFHGCRILVVDTAGYFSQLSTFSAIKGERKGLRHGKHVFLAVHSSRLSISYHDSTLLRCSSCNTEMLNFLFILFLHRQFSHLSLSLLYLLPFVETAHIYTNGNAASESFSL